MLLKAATITDRLALPAGVRFIEGVSVELLYRHSISRPSFVELFFRLTLGKNKKLYETDTVLRWEALPPLVENDEAWKKVGSLVSKTKCKPDAAYLVIAFEFMLQNGWTFEADINKENDGLELIIHLDSRGATSTSVDVPEGIACKFFHFDPELLKGRN